MKRTININFQGQLVTIEETAYHLLNKYIQSLKDYFKHEADGSEIVNDIENRIAELFGNRLKHGIPCITDEDVTSIINTIGRPEEFDMEYEESENTINQGQYETYPNSQMPPPPSIEPRKSLYRNTSDSIIGGVCSGLGNYLKVDPVFIRLLFVLLFSLLFWVYIILWIVLPAKNLVSNVSKRLYRNPNDSFIGGVCGGLATYFKIDTWIPRVIFLLPLIFNVLGIARIPFLAFSNIFRNFDWSWNINVNLSFVGIYIVLWIIMPKAVSIKQKLEMMGEDEYLKSIRATVSGSVAQVKSRTESDNLETNTNSNQISYSEENPQIETSNNDNLHNNMPPPPPVNHNYRDTTQHSYERSGCLNALVVLLKVVFFGIAGAVAASLMISLFALIFTGTHFIPLESLFVNRGYEHTLLWLTIILSLVVPILGVIIWIVRRIMKTKSRPIIGYTVAGLWLVGIIAGLTLSYRITKKFSTERIEETDFVLEQPSSNNFYVEMSKHPFEYYRLTNNFFNKFEFDEFPLYDENEEHLLFNSIQIKNKQSKDSIFYIKTTFKTMGENNKAAMLNIKGFDFRIQQNDSILYIPQFFTVPKSHGYRKQSIIVEIYTPSNVKVHYDDNIIDYQTTVNRNSKRNRSISREYNRYDNNYNEDINLNDSINNMELINTDIVRDSL